MNYYSLLLVLGFVACAKSILCPDGWDLIVGEKCVKFNETLRTFQEAQNFCEGTFYCKKVRPVPVWIEELLLAQQFYSLQPRTIHPYPRCPKPA